MGNGDRRFSEQVEWFRRKCAEAVPGWRELKERIERLLPELADPDRIRLKDHLLFHVELHLSGCEGFEALGKSHSAYREGNYPLAFVYAAQAMWKYEKGLIALKQAEHGKWENFFRADWLTNIESKVQTWIRFAAGFACTAKPQFLCVVQAVSDAGNREAYLPGEHAS
ncbi:hypothetical protein [Paenibacillus harenae]|uniref:hypothetical protein n=1 Tax=Paenibacillus harenae TaxID=306543 RepID=UPI000414D0DA|nr:hypothetical protein [Paenibacillus harenae]